MQTEKIPLRVCQDAERDGSRTGGETSPGGWRRWGDQSCGGLLLLDKVGPAVGRLLGEEVGEPLNGVHAGLLDAALSDLRQRRIRHATASGYRALWDGLGP
jgi:hypothetical protein